MSGWTRLHNAGYNPSWIVSLIRRLSMLMMTKLASKSISISLFGPISPDVFKNWWIWVTHTVHVAQKNGELDNLYSPLLSSSWGSLNFGLHSLSKTSPFRFMFSKISNVELQKKHNSKSRDTSGNDITAYWKITKMSRVAIVTTSISLLWIWKNCVILCARKYCLNHWLVFFNL